MKIKKISIAVMVFILLLFVGCQQVDEEPVKNNKEITKVTTDVIGTKDLDEITMSIGQLSPNSTYQVVALSPGEVIEAHYNIGDFVNKDDVLFVLDQEDFTETKDNQLTQLRISLNQAKISLEDAKKNYEDNQTLYAVDSISKSQLDMSKSQYEQARLQYQNVLTQIETTKDNLDNQEDNLIIKSPVSGIIANKNIEKDMYATNQNGYTIIKNDPIIFKVGVIEEYISKVRVGQKAEVYINALDMKVNGKIKSVGLVKEGTTYPVEVEIDNQDLEILPGMYAEVNIVYNRINSAVVIPNGAIINKSGQSFIYLINNKSTDGSTVKKAYVTPINIYGQYTYIEESELLGEELVIKGSQFINQESLVEIQD